MISDRIRERLDREIASRMSMERDSDLSTLQLHTPRPREQAIRVSWRAFALSGPSDDRVRVLYLCALAGTGKVRRALDDLYDLVDEVVRTKDFDRCDQLFAQVSPDRMGLQMAIGLLTITLPFKQQLPHRRAFVLAARESLRRSDPEKAERLFAGLE